MNQIQNALLVGMNANAIDHGAEASGCQYSFYLGMKKGSEDPVFTNQRLAIRQRFDRMECLQPSRSVALIEQSRKPKTSWLHQQDRCSQDEDRRCS